MGRSLRWLSWRAKVSPSRNWIKIGVHGSPPLAILFISIDSRELATRDEPAHTDVARHTVVPLNLRKRFSSSDHSFEDRFRYASHAQYANGIINTEPPKGVTPSS